MIEKSSAMSLPSGAWRRKPSGLWTRSASNGLTHCGPIGAPVLRSENGLIFQSRRVRQTCWDYRLQPEFITPYTPEQNGIIEWFFRSLKEGCIWQHVFQTSRRHGGLFETDCGGTTTKGLIRRWSAEVPPNTGRNKYLGGLIAGEHYNSSRYCP
jgi:transposase InsO family protein